MEMRIASMFIIIFGILTSAIADVGQIEYIKSSDTWKYTHKDLLPEIASSYTLNDRHWKTGRAPFSSLKSGDFAHRTYWPLNTSFWVRKSAFIKRSADLKVYLAVDNGFELYWNGVFIRKEYGGSTYRWEYSFTIPSSVVRKGKNIIAIRLIDNGGIDAFDMKLIESPGISIQDGIIFNPMNSHYYKIVKTPNGITWNDANSTAMQMKFKWMRGHLAAINSIKENDFITNAIHNGGKTYTYWLGGYQQTGSKEPSGGWRWVTGEKWIFTKWAPQEPSNGSNREDALELRPDGFWNDRWVNEWNSNIGYIVEFEPK